MLLLPDDIAASSPSGDWLPASIQLDAASQKEGSLPSFSILANTGEPMDISGFQYPVIVDISGASFARGTTPIIMEHNVDRRVGHSTSQVVDKVTNSITLSGVVSSKSEDAARFVEDSRNDFPFQASIGARILKKEFCPAGSTVSVNGKSWDGPLIVARQSKIREVSITLLGADGKTSSVAATAPRTSTKDSNNMDFSEWLKAKGFDESTLSAAQLNYFKAAYQKEIDDDEDDEDEEDSNALSLSAHRQQLAAEAKRVASIDVHFRQYANVSEVTYNNTKLSVGDFKAAAIQDGLDARDVELALLRANRPAPSKAPAGYSVDASYDNKVLEAAICRDHRLKNLEKAYSADVLNKADEKQYRNAGSIQNLLTMTIQAAGGHAPIDRSSSEFVKAAIDANYMRAEGFSTISVTNVLENVMHKFTLEAFGATESIWPAIAGTMSLSDFKPHALYRLDYSGHFRKVPIDGQLTHISMVDLKKTLTADTYGCMVAIDRKTIKNDDLGIVIARCRGIGNLGALRLEEAVMVTLLGNAGSFFSAGNSNLITGAGSALSIAALNTAKQTFRDQIINGKPINISPNRLLVGTALEVVAGQLYSDAELQWVGGGTNTLAMKSNPHRGMYRPLVTGYLNNTGITDQDGNALSGQSATQFYLFPDPESPQGSAVKVGFLDNKREPYFDSAETDFNIPGGIQFRSYFDFGVALHIPQMALKSAGA